MHEKYTIPLGKKHMVHMKKNSVLFGKESYISHVNMLEKLTISF